MHRHLQTVVFVRYASYVMFRVSDASAFGISAAVGMLWMVRNVLSLWEKLAVCKKIATHLTEVTSSDAVMEYDRGRGTWRIRTVNDYYPLFPQEYSPRIFLLPPKFLSH